jgi:hypothetical protein
VVGVLNDQSGEYHRYVTNIPIDWIPAEHIRDAYRLRWEVETFYKLAKSGAALDELPSVQPHIVRAMVIAALFRVTTATMLRARHGHKIPAGRRVNPIAWVRHVIASLGAVSAALAIEDGEDDNALFPRAVLDPTRVPPEAATDPKLPTRVSGVRRSSQAPGDPDGPLLV